MRQAVTYLFDYENIDAKSRSYVMHEFAVNGAKHLVLTDTLLRQILFDRNLADQLRKEMAEEGLDFMDAHAVFGKYLDMNCPVPEARCEMLVRLKTQLYIAHSLGVRTITIHTGNETQHPEYDLEAHFEGVKRSLDELLPVAESLDMVICIENIWFQLNTPERLLALKEAFPTEALGFCFDAGHANLMRNAPVHLPESRPCMAWGDLTPAWDDHILEKMLPHIVNCHLHDNNGVLDQHKNAGDGTVQWEIVMPQLAKAPRLEVLQSEVIPVKNNVAIRELCAAFERLKTLG